LPAPGVRGDTGVPGVFKDMRFEHRSFEQNGQRLDEVVDLKNETRIVVSDHGAELVGVAKRPTGGDWVGYLYRDGDTSVPASGWKSHATVMGYFIHRLVGEHTLYEGEEIQGGNHSFIRTKVFAAPEVLVSEENATLRYRLPAEAIDKKEYPRRVAFQVDYVLSGEDLSVVFSFVNQEQNRPAHVSFGLHPGFRVSSIDDARIILPRGTYRRYLAPGNFLSGQTVDFSSAGDSFPAKPFELPDSFLIQPIDVDEYVVKLQDLKERREIQIDLSEAPFFTIWSDLNPFICVEPCWGLPDHKEQEPFEKKVGIQVIPPHGTLSRRCSFRFL
jgi:galactose mutarotase-like enzyme